MRPPSKIKNTVRLMVWLTLALGVGLLTRPAVACRCAPVDDAAHLTATPIIFTGRVMPGRPETDGRALIFRFEITETWKGSLPAAVAVRTPRSSATCGASFEPGRSYTVFAIPFRQDQLETGACQLAPFQSRPELFTKLINNYRAQVAEWDRLIATAENMPDKQRGKLAFLLSNNDWTAAVLTLDALLARPPKDRVALLAQRGLLNYRLLRLNAARSDFTTVLRLDPRSSVAMRALGALDRLDEMAAPARADAQRLWPEPFESAVTP